jgi:hypothetical protein
MLIDNRYALIVDCKGTQSVGTGKQDATKAMAAAISGAYKKTLGADKNYDIKGMVAQLRRIGDISHVALNTRRPGGSAIDSRTPHVGYAKSINACRASRRCLVGSSSGAGCDG